MVIRIIEGTKYPHIFNITYFLKLIKELKSLHCIYLSFVLQLPVSIIFINFAEGDYELLLLRTSLVPIHRSHDYIRDLNHYYMVSCIMWSVFFLLSKHLLISWATENFLIHADFSLLQTWNHYPTRIPISFCGEWTREKFWCWRAGGGRRLPLLWDSV